MAIRSWTDLDKHALKASRKKGISPVARDFFKIIYAELVKEKRRKRSAGDKQGLVSCIKPAMENLINDVTSEFSDAKCIKYRINVPGLPRGKFPDYSIRRGNKIYLIEQKSILRFNEFSQVFFEALLAKRNGIKGTRIRFVGLFNYLHQEREAFEKLCKIARTWIVDRLFILIPDRSYLRGYDPREIESLHKDMVEWLK